MSLMSSRACGQMAENLCVFALYAALSAFRKHWKAQLSAKTQRTANDAKKKLLSLKRLVAQTTTATYIHNLIATKL